MKQYLALAALAGFVFISCKKDRVCNCTITTSGTATTHVQTAGFPPFVAETDTTTTQPTGSINIKKTSFDKVSKKDMRSSCPSHSEESLSDGSTNSSPGVFTITTTNSGKRTYDCTID